jgi:hypothetical protein
MFLKVVKLIDPGGGFSGNGLRRSFSRAFHSFLESFFVQVLV